MSRTTRIFVFPGGLLELEADKNDDDAAPGFYLECFVSGDDEVRDERSQGR